MRIHFFVALAIVVFLPKLLIAQQQHLTVTRIGDGVFVHTSYKVLDTSPFPSNGLIVETPKQVVLVDTGWDDEQTQELLDWVKTNLHKPVTLCITTHFHEDRVSGTALLRRNGVTVICTPLTAKKATAIGVAAPDGILPNDTTLNVDGTPIRVYYPGKGHTEDNIVVYLPMQKILFGGCLVKSVESPGMGNVADAYLSEWKSTINTVKTTFADARIIVPGHQKWSGQEALRHTLQLLDKP